MIPPETLAQIKERTDIVALIGETVRLVRRGRSHVGLCPFHKEKSPSFHVHGERGFFHCFGCQESGSAIDFVMKTNGLEFIEAVKMLAERAGIQIEEVKNERGRAQKSERDELYAVMMLAASFYADCMGVGDAKRPPHKLAHHALAELAKRGCPPLGTESDEAARWAHAIAAFRMGYAPAEWNLLADFLKQQGISPSIGERAGLLVPGQRGHYDRFRHRLMFAVVDSLGRVIAFSGRALAAPEKHELTRDMPAYDGDAPAKYINSPESPIYKKGEQLFGLFQAKQGIRQRSEALLVEGNFDVVTLHARGVDNAIAPLGTAFTSEQAKLMKRFAPRVTILFDGDAAGKKATRAARVPCHEGGLEARVATLPAGMDPDDFVRKHGAEALTERIKGAHGMLEHLIQEALDGEGFSASEIDGQKARIRHVLKLLSEEPDENARIMGKRFADVLSKTLVVRGVQGNDLSELERMVGQALARPAPAPATGEARRRQPTAEEAIALKALGAILDFPDLLRDPEVVATLQWLEGDFALSIVAVRQRLLGQADSRADLADFLATLPRSIQRFAAGRLASPSFEEIADAKTELLENIGKLEARGLERMNSADRGALERSTSIDAENALLREIEQRVRTKKGLD